MNARLRQGLYLTDGQTLYRVLSVHVSGPMTSPRRSVLCEDCAHPERDPLYFEASDPAFSKLRPVEPRDASCAA